MRIILTNREGGNSPILFARDLHAKMGGPLRVPHHSVSEAGMLGELTLAAGGVLVLDEAREIRASVLRSLFGRWGAMHPEFRPLVVVDVSGEARCNMYSMQEEMARAGWRSIPPCQLDPLAVYMWRAWEQASETEGRSWKRSERREPYHVLAMLMGDGTIYERFR